MSAKNNGVNKISENIVFRFTVYHMPKHAN